ncbi:class I SAM-dependent methyltransferase [Paenibacillus nasutitermitis]|uniref:Methyltransferase n=1 Tax=Paenibacillus nasutitermitis TaxID=1652958 RepID=A0A916YRC4_9BACL|nr:class I SAM-dependent methyltransferase [Paenibacillus nasutitermitis]GGD57779.1 methyltransferase [Paenibacillus nasutitermitis]
MNQGNFEEAREAEASYHHELYTDHEILKPGSWMAKPIPLVMELLERLLTHKENVKVLDLGSGPGRNTIPIALRLKETNSKVVGIDLLDEAVGQLLENAEKYKIADKIQAKVGDAEHADILENDYDYIVACGCLEHVSSKEAFIAVLEKMKRGTRIGGIHCIEMNTGIQELDKASGRELETLIELNLPQQEALRIFEEVYQGWNVLEKRTKLQTIEEEKYEEPSEFRANSITFAVQKM